MRNADAMFKVLERNESLESVEYVINSAYEQLAKNADVSIKDFKKALGIVAFEGYYGYDGQGDGVEEYMSLSAARDILHRAANGEPPNDYGFHAAEWDWTGQDEDGYPLPNAVIFGYDQMRFVFKDYIEIYGSMP